MRLSTQLHLLIRYSCDHPSDAFRFFVFPSPPFSFAGLVLGTVHWEDRKRIAGRTLRCSPGPFLGALQGFIDGAPPVPEVFARGGIRVLGSWPLRSLANQLAYTDTDTYATDDAIRVGRAPHTSLVVHARRWLDTLRTLPRRTSPARAHVRRLVDTRHWLDTLPRRLDPPPPTPYREAARRVD